jgi:hypothetical protein
VPRTGDVLGACRCTDAGFDVGPPGGRGAGRLEKTVPDCPDPRALARFHGGLLGMHVVEDDAWR